MSNSIARQAVGRVRGLGQRWRVLRRCMILRWIKRSIVAGLQIIRTRPSLGWLDIETNVASLRVRHVLQGWAFGTASRPAGRTIEDWIRGHVAAAAARV